MKTKFSTLFFVINLLTFSSIFGQTSSDFFTYLKQSEIKSSKNENSNEAFEKTKKDKDVKSYDFISYGDLADFAQDGTITLTLPKIGEVTFKETLNKYADRNNYEWEGEVNSDKFGYAYLFCENGRMYGHISVDENTFQIKAYDTGVSLIVETIKHNGKMCNGKGASIDNGEVIESHSSFRVLPCTQLDRARVLVVYTQRALDAVGLQTIQERVNVSISQFNSAYSSSGISNARAQLVLAGLEATTFTETTSSMGNGNGTTNAGGTLNQPNEDFDVSRLPAALEARRSATNSDIVICLTDANYQFSYGVANAINANYNQSFASVEIRRIPDQPVFPHEIGHLYGGRHEYGTTQGYDPTPGDAHGYVYLIKSGFLNLTKKYYATLMCPKKDNGEIRTNRWSNPNRTDSGVATGTTTLNNVARTINLNADKIANFRAAVPQLQASIIGTSYITSYGVYTYEAGVSCNSGPYTYKWEKSSNGFNYSQVGTSEFYNLTVYPGSNSAFYLKLTVTGSGGQIATNFMTVSVPAGTSARIARNQSSISEPSSEEVKPISESYTHGESEEFSLIKSVYPNPTYEDISAKVELSQIQDLSLELIDDKGQLVKNIFSGKGKIGENSYSTRLPKLKPGIYYLRVKTSEKSEIKRIVVE